MEDYFKRMNEEYIKKNYPERSVFKAYKKSMGSRGRTGCIIMGLFMAGGLAGLIWSVRKTLEFMQSGDDETMKVGIVIGIFFLIVTLFFGGILFLVTKDMRRSMEEWISRIAAAGGCSEGEMREFDNQAVEPDSLIVNLLGKIKAVTAGQKSGILTRDYIALYNSGSLGVLKVSRITGAYLTDNVYNVKVGNSIKQAHYLTINLITADKKNIWAETSKEAGRALQAILMERCPEIDTAGGAVLPESEIVMMKR